MLSGMDPASGQYAAISSAIAYLESVLSAGLSQGEIITAMSLLTQAMAGFY
mgnify:FL=1